MTEYSPTELIVHDGYQPCPYLPGEVARTPLRWPTSRLTPEQFDLVLQAGDRRSGAYLYRPECQQCRACESLRIEVEAYRLSRTQRRVFARCEAELTIEIGSPQVTEERVKLFNAHRNQRGMSSSDGDIDLAGYEAFLVDTCCETCELSFRFDGRLIAVSIADRGATSLSAVYCLFDPEFSHLSLGVYSILKEIELCRAWNLKYLYLGYFIAASEHMSYKARYLPHERLIEGSWRRFEKRAAESRG